MFYLIEITTYADETKDAYGVYPYDNYVAAEAAFHQKLAGAMRNENYKYELCMVIDGKGSTMRHEFYEKPVETNG